MATTDAPDEAGYTVPWTRTEWDREHHDDVCEAEFIGEAGRWSPCRCDERTEEQR